MTVNASLGSPERPVRIAIAPELLTDPKALAVSDELRSRGLTVEVPEIPASEAVDTAAQLRVALLENNCDLVIQCLERVWAVQVPGIVDAAILARPECSDEAPRSHSHSGDAPGPVGFPHTLVVEARQDDLENAEVGRLLRLTLRYLDDVPTRLAVLAERAGVGRLQEEGYQDIGASGCLRWADSLTPGAASGTLQLLLAAASPNQPRREINGDTVVPLGVEAAERDYACSAAEELGVAVAEELMETFEEEA